MAGPGAKTWVFPGGHIPFPSNGEEPEFTGFEQLCVLNAGDREVQLELTIYYEDQDPVGPYPLTVGAQRIRHIRFNDLVDPEAIRLDRPFGCLLTASAPVVVQVRRQDTRLPGALAAASMMAFPA